MLGEAEVKPRVATLLRVIPSSDQHMLYIYSPVDGSIKIANAVTKRVLDLCDGSRDLAEIASVLAEEFEGDALVIQADVQALLDTLRREGLVV